MKQERFVDVLVEDQCVTVQNIESSRYISVNHAKFLEKQARWLHRISFYGLISISAIAMLDGIVKVSTGMANKNTELVTQGIASLFLGNGILALDWGYVKPKLEFSNKALAELDNIE